MRRTLVIGFFAVVCAFFVGCASPQFFTVTIYDSPQRVVRLQTMEVEGQGYAHPPSITKEQMTKVLDGLYVEIDSTAFSSSNTRRKAFSDREVQFFAPLLVKGLQQATPEEVVTFFETAEISDLHEATTSGGVFVKDHALHIILSNHGAKSLIWQDNDGYEAPHRLRPLEPIDPEPGRVVFAPNQYMQPVNSPGWIESLKGRPWHTAVSYEEIAP